MRKRFSRVLIGLVLIIAMLLSVPTSAAAILSGDDELEDLLATTNWNTDLLTAQEWTVSTRGTSYTISRESSYVKDYYEDILTTTKAYLGIQEGSGGNQIAEVAKAEVGADGSVEYGGYNSNLAKYTDGSWDKWPYGAAEWCAIFVMWCADQCGYIESGLFPDPRYDGPVAVTSGLLGWMLDNSGCEMYDLSACKPFSSTGYTPMPGDLIFYKDSGWSSYYSGPSTQHVGIIVEVTETAVITVEGNVRNQVSKLALTTPNGYGHGCIVLHVPYPAEDGEQGIFNFLVNYGFNEAAACGILANIYVETAGTFDPSIEEFANKIGFGLCQWSFGRRTLLINWCENNGYDPASTHGQLSYMIHELETSYTSTLRQLKSVDNSASGAYQAAGIFCRGFERPANTESQASYRGRLAESMFWPEYAA